ncbi:MAG TPA: nuclear transport factor 2 family protein [Candidatus Binatia bacterium]|nr:nuclear transport factor 2 family protein [Candidatus Binatia bacterium]
MSQENMTVIRGMYESFSKGDVTSVLGQMHQHIEWREAENFIYADRNPYRGPQAVLEGVFMRLASEWADFKVMPEEWLDAGNHIVVLGTYSGRHKESSREVRAQFAHIWGVTHGRVVRFQQYTDTKQFADAIA